MSTLRPFCKPLLVADGGGPPFEKGAAPQRARARERARRENPWGKRAVRGGEFCVGKSGGAINLNVDEVVHGHTCSAEGGLVSVEKILDFIFDFLGRLSSLGVETDVTGEIERVPGKDGVAEGRLNRLFRQVDSAALGLSITLRKCAGNAEDGREAKGNKQNPHTTVHGELLIKKICNRRRV